MNNEDMMLDLDTFSFDDIDSGKATVEATMPKPFDFNDIADEEEEGFDFDEDDVEGEEDYEEEEEDVEDTTSITDALSQLGAIADDYELDFGSTKVAKGDLVKLIADRETITKTRDAIDGFAQRLVDREHTVTVAFDVAKTETDKQLEHVYSMLNDPNKWNSATDVAQLQKNRIHLEARKAELTAKETEARSAIAEQKQQAAVFNIQKVVQEMGGNGALNEAATYAQSKGIDLDHLVQGLTPAMVVALQNAAKYEALVNKNKTKLAETAKAKKPRSAPVKGAKTGPRGVKANEKARAQALFAQGKLSHADMFNFLED